MCVSRDQFYACRVFRLIFSMAKYNYNIANYNICTDQNSSNEKYSK